MTFIPKWFEEIGFTRIDKSIFMLHNSFEPLVDVEGCSTSKFEHSLIL